MQRLAGIIWVVAFAGPLGCKGAAQPRTWDTAAIDQSMTNQRGYLSSVWGTGADDVFVVGGSPDGLIYHYDGQDWQTQFVPANTPLLNWVFGFSSNDVFAVGNRGAFLRYDGSAWSAVDSGTELDLFGVWGRSADDIWLVGGDFNGDGPPVILHWDGSSIEAVALDAEQNPFSAHALFKVWGIGSRTLAVGQDGLILEWDGSDWLRVTAGTMADQDFVSLWGTTEQDIVVVGGRGTPRIATSVAGEFETTIPQGDTIGKVNAVFACADDVVVGGDSFVGAFDPGGSVSVERTTPYDIHGAWIDCETGTAISVGGRGFDDYPGVAWISRL